MRAVLLAGNGGFDCLALRDDVLVPQPGTGAVLIQVAAAGVNNSDINTRTECYSKSVDSASAAGGAERFAGAQTEDSGWTGAVPQFPRIQGADACGNVVAVGAGVDAAWIGERVLVEPVFRAIGAGLGEAVYFGSERDGGFVEYTTAPLVHTHRITSELSDVKLASFPCAYSAVENMLTRVALTPGERVLITGALSRVGSAAVLLAVRRGGGRHRGGRFRQGRSGASVRSEPDDHARNGFGRCTGRRKR